MLGYFPFLKRMVRGHFLILPMDILSQTHARFLVCVLCCKAEDVSVRSRTTEFLGRKTLKFPAEKDLLIFASSGLSLVVGTGLG